MPREEAPKIKKGMDAPREEEPKIIKKKARDAPREEEPNISKKKARDARHVPAGHDESKMSKFHLFNLKELNIPKEAWPSRDGVYNGRWGYTVWSDSGAAT